MNISPNASMWPRVLIRTYPEKADEHQTLISNSFPSAAEENSFASVSPKQVCTDKIKAGASFFLHVGLETFVNLFFHLLIRLRTIFLLLFLRPL